MALSFFLSLVVIGGKVGLLARGTIAATVTRSIPGLNGADHLTTFSGNVLQSLAVVSFWYCCMRFC